MALIYLHGTRFVLRAVYPPRCPGIFVERDALEYVTESRLGLNTSCVVIHAVVFLSDRPSSALETVVRNLVRYDWLLQHEQVGKDGFDLVSPIC